MSLYETGDSTGEVSLKDLFCDNMENKITGEVTLERLIYYAVRGGWPGNLETPEKTCGKLAKEYLKTIVDDDMFSVDGVKRDSRKVWSLLHSLGRNESTLAGNSTLRKDMGVKDEIEIDRDTISDYLDIFQRLFILDDQPAYNINLRSSRRILKSAKRHFTDPSLAVAALGATPKMLLNDLNTFGFIFESLCEHDLKIYAESIDAHIYHYQDYKEREIDTIIELNDGRWCAVEIKLGANQIESAAENLKKIYKEMEQDPKSILPSAMIIICGLSNAAYQREDGIYVVPLTALKD